MQISWFQEEQNLNCLIQIILQFSVLVVVRVNDPLFSPFSGFYLENACSSGEIKQWWLRLKSCTSLMHFQSTWQVGLIIRDGIRELSLLRSKYLLLKKSVLLQTGWNKGVTRQGFDIVLKLWLKYFHFDTLYEHFKKSKCSHLIF